MSADKSSTAARETEKPTQAPPPQDKPAPQPRDYRSDLERNQDVVTRPPMQRAYSSEPTRPDSGSRGGNDARQLGGTTAAAGRGGDHWRDSGPGAVVQGKRAPHGMVSDLEHNRAVMARPPMQRRPDSSLVTEDRGPDSRTGAAHDAAQVGGTRHSAGSDRTGTSTNRGIERTDISQDNTSSSASADHTGATRSQPDQQGRSELRSRSPVSDTGQAAAPGGRHDLADESEAGRDLGVTRADGSGIGQELNCLLGGTTEDADGRDAVDEADLESSDKFDLGSAANPPQDYATVASNQEQVGTQDRGQLGAPDAEAEPAPEQPVDAQRLAAMEQRLQSAFEERMQTAIDGIKSDYDARFDAFKAENDHDKAELRQQIGDLQAKLDAAQRDWSVTSDHPPDSAAQSGSSDTSDVLTSADRTDTAASGADVSQEDEAAVDGRVGSEPERDAPLAVAKRSGFSPESIEAGKAAVGLAGSLGLLPPGLGLAMDADAARRAVKDMSPEDQHAAMSLADTAVTAFGSMSPGAAAFSVGTSFVAPAIHAKARELFRKMGHKD